jgi:hypothetical protein
LLSQVGFLITEGAGATGVGLTGVAMMGPGAGTSGLVAGSSTVWVSTVSVVIGAVFMKLFWIGWLVVTGSAAIGGGFGGSMRISGGVYSMLIAGVSSKMGMVNSMPARFSIMPPPA